MDLIGYCNKLISEEKVYDDDFISGLKVKNIVEKKYKEIMPKVRNLKRNFEYKTGKNHYLEWFDECVGSCLNIDSIRYDENANKLEVEIYHSSDFNKRYNISFIKDNDNLIIDKSNYYNCEEILENEDIFSSLYDLYKENYSYLHSSFFINYPSVSNPYDYITFHAGMLGVKIGDAVITRDFYEARYKYLKINNKNDLSYLQDNIETILGHLYFSLSMMPEFIQKEVKEEIEMKKNRERWQLQEKERKIKMEQEQQEINLKKEQEKKERMEKIKCKFIPFYKKNHTLK